MDIFNKKKLKDVEKERDYYLNRCQAKNKTIDTLNEQISLLNKELRAKDSTINKLFDENATLIEWIQKILEVCDTQTINYPYKSITIPICKQVKSDIAAEDWLEYPRTRTDIYIPAIHFSQID